MSEWAVVTVIVTLTGLLVALITPIVKLCFMLSRMNTTVETLEKKLKSLSEENSRSSDKLWTHIGEQDKRLGTQETRVAVLESRSRGRGNI